jgi:hypothetical protein
MGSPKESLEQKNVFTEKYDEIRRLDGKHQDLTFSPFAARGQTWDLYILPKETARMSQLLSGQIKLSPLLLD